MQLVLKTLLFAVLLTYTSQELTWEKLTAISGSVKARRDTAIGYNAVDETVYIFGGMIGENDEPLNDMHTFGMNSKVWKQIQISSSTRKPYPRYGTVFGSRGDYMYVATGEGVLVTKANQKERTIFNDIWRFKFSDSSWLELSSGNVNLAARQSAAGGIHKDDSTFYVSHGLGKDELFSHSYTYDTAKSGSTTGWEEIFSGTNSYDPRFPHSRAKQSSVVISNSKLLLFGGCLSGQGTGGPCPSDDSWIFDKASKEWTELNRCSTPKVFSAMALLPLQNSTKERVVLWGGNADERTVLVSDDENEDEVAVFNVEENKWMMKKVKPAEGNEKFPPAREGHAMITTKYGIVVFGGQSLSGNLLSDVWLLKGSSEDADQSPDGRECGRQFFNLIMLHGVFMFIGWSVFMIMGVFAARYFRFLQPLWYRIHMVFQVLGVVFVLAGTICGIISVPSHQHFKFVHSIFGYIIFVMVVQQPFNAMLRPQPTEQGYNCGRTCWEAWHKWSGRVTLLASIINVTLGLFMAIAPTLVWALWLGYLGLWFVIFVAAEILKRPFEKDLRKRAKKPVIYDTTNPYRISKGQVNTAF